MYSKLGFGCIKKFHIGEFYILSMETSQRLFNQGDTEGNDDQIFRDKLC